MTRRLAACLLVLAATAATAAPAEQAYRFPAYAGAAEVEAECQRLLTDLRQSEQQLADGKADGAVLRELDAMKRRYDDTLGPLGLLAAVHPAKAVRDAADACEQAHQAFAGSFLQNPQVYARLKQVQPGDAIDQRFLRHELDDFEDSGVALPSAPQARVRAIGLRLTQLTQDFDRRIREDKTRVAFTAAELAGVPRAVWQGAPRDAKQRYLIGLDYPSSVPVIENAVDASTRERMWRATQNLGGADNIATLAELVSLRHEYATLFGLDSYADFALRRRMAGSAAAVQTLLGEINGAVGQRELADLAQLRAAKARHLKQDAASTVIQRWDVAFYTERLRRARYAVDPEQFRRYFPPEASLEFVFELAQRLFGVRFSPLRQVLWHADARAFELRDAGDGRLLGTLYVDLYPRADKYNHAATWNVRSVSTQAQRLPVAALVANFNRQGLTIEELETLLHEFGHALHDLLSTTRYASQGGTEVQLDYVEAPSQMLEEWVYDPRVLALFQQVCARCKPVPAPLLAQAERARRVAKGIAYGNQHLYASYDLALYGKQPGDPLALWARMQSERPLGYAAGTMFPAGFAHIATNYAAGYYSYLWSEVLADDLRTAFAADRLDPAVGRRYRASVLARGDEVAPADLLREFLGRPSDSRAFFKELNRP